MSGPQLKPSLDALRAEIAGLEASHAEDKARLARLVSELERASKEATPPAGLAGRVHEAVLHFEVEHPKVTSILNDVLTALGNVGI